MTFDSQYMGKPVGISETERKILGLWCSYYAYLESMDNMADKLDQGYGRFPSQKHAGKAEEARRAAIRRLGLFGEGMTDKEMAGLREQALRFSYEEQLLFATQTKMYEEFLKDIKP